MTSALYAILLMGLRWFETIYASPQSDIPTKILKQNSDYFAKYFYEPMYLKINISIRFEISWCSPVYKKKSKTPKITIGR